MIRRIFVFLLLSALLSVPALATELESALGLQKLYDAVPPEAEAALGELRPESPDAEGAIQRLLDYAQSRIYDAGAEILRPLAAIAAICLLSGIGGSLSPGRTGPDAVALGSCLAIAVIGVEDVHSVMALGSRTLTALLDFSRVLLPVLMTAAATSGAVGAAGASYAAAALWSDILLSAAERFLLPLICAFTAAATASGVLGDSRLDGAVRFLRWCARSGMKLLVLGFTAYLSLTGILASAADAAAVKAAKTVLSAALPVVGKLMADASEALVAGAGLLRSAVGVYGMLVCLAIVLLPVLRLGLRCLLFRGAAAVCSGIAGQRQAKLISDLADAYGMLLGLVGSGAAMEFLAIISLIRTVTT